MKRILSLLLLAASWPLLACWSYTHTSLIRENEKGAGLVLVSAGSGLFQESGADIALGIDVGYVYGSVIAHNSETGETVISEETVITYPVNRRNISLYFYRLTGENNDSYQVGPLLVKKDFTLPDTINSGKLGGIQSDFILGKLSDFMDEFSASETKVICCLEPFAEGRWITLADRSQAGLGWSRPANVSAVISRESDLTTTTRKTVDFSGCSLSVTGTELPLTPVLTVAPVTVTNSTFNIQSRRFSAKTLRQTAMQIMPTAALDVTQETTSYTAPVTSANLTVTDDDGSSELFRSTALQSGIGLPVWGRYSIAPWGIVAGEQLKLDLVLTADGINSNQAADSLTVVTRPAVSSVTVTVTGDNRPER